MAWDPSQGAYRFDNGRTVILRGMPPAPIVWTYNTIDTLCEHAGCANWRHALHLNDNPESWWSDTYRVPPLKQYYPHLITFDEFRKQQPQQSYNDNTSLPTLAHTAYRYAFHTPSTALGDLTTPTAGVVLLALILGLRACKAIVVPWCSALGRAAAVRTHGATWVTDNPVRITKFGEYVFRLVYHTTIAVYGLVYFYDKEWWQTGNTVAVFRGYPYHEIQPGMAWYYLMQAAYNLDALYSLVVLSLVVQLRSPLRRPNQNTPMKSSSSSRSNNWQSPIVIQWSPTVRGDFQEMMVHHIITNALVIGSSLVRITRVGSMVFLIHDIADVPVDLSKLFNFLKWKWTTLASFTVMTVVWMYTRLTILPFTIYRCVLMEGHYLLQEGIPVLCFLAYRHFFYVFTGLLILLHLAWFVMFLRMFHTFWVKMECHDLSEHKNGEEQQPPPHGPEPPPVPKKVQ